MATNPLTSLDPEVAMGSRRPTGTTPQSFREQVRYDAAMQQKQAEADRMALENQRRQWAFEKHERDLQEYETKLNIQSTKNEVDNRILGEQNAIMAHIRGQATNAMGQPVPFPDVTDKNYMRAIQALSIAYPLGFATQPIQEVVGIGTKMHETAMQAEQRKEAMLARAAKQRMSEINRLSEQASKVASILDINPNNLYSKDESTGEYIPNRNAIFSAWGEVVKRGKAEDDRLGGYTLEGLRRLKTDAEANAKQSLAIDDADAEDRARGYMAEASFYGGMIDKFATEANKKNALPQTQPSVSPIYTPSPAKTSLPPQSGNPLPSGNKVVGSTLTNKVTGAVSYYNGNGGYIPEKYWNPSNPNVKVWDGGTEMTLKDYLSKQGVDLGKQGSGTKTK